MLTAYQYLQGKIFAISPDGFASVLAVAQSHLDRDNRIDPEAVAKRLGRPLDNTQAAILRPDGVAVIPVYGAIGRHMTMMKAISGGSTIEGLSNDFHVALENPNVRAIVFDHDSPGGEVNGTSELAGLIRAARGIKPIIAYVSNLSASAAYWLASACDEIVAAPTASLGSIGVMAVLPPDDPSKPPPTIFINSLSPKKNVDPHTDEGKSEIMGMIDDVASVFLGDVAANRGVSVETVQADYGQGGMLIASRAVEAGLADRIGGLESLCAELAGDQERIAAGVVPLRPAALAAAALSHVHIPLSVPLDPSGVRATTSGSSTLYGWQLDATTRAEAFVDGENISFRTVAAGDEHPAPAEDEEDESAATPPSTTTPNPESTPPSEPAEEIDRQPTPSDTPAEGAPPANDEDEARDRPSDEADDASADQPPADAGHEGGAMSATPKSLSAQLEASGASAEVIAQAKAMEANEAARVAQAEGLTERVRAMERKALEASLKAEVLGHSNDGIVWLGAADENVATLLAMCDAFGGAQSEQVQRFIAQQRSIATSMEASTTIEVGTDYSPLGLSSLEDGGATSASAEYDEKVRAYMESHDDVSYAQAFDACRSIHRPLAQKMYLEQNSNRGQMTYGVLEFNRKNKKGTR